MPQNQNQSLDAVDEKLINALAQNARIAMSDLARLVGLSPPSAAERVRKLEASGIIQGFTAQLDAKALGYPLQAIVRIRPLPGQLHRVEHMIQSEPRFLECDKVTGDDCFIARLCLRSIEELDALLDGLHARAETNTAIVKSSPVARRSPPVSSKIAGAEHERRRVSAKK
jgi:Lrp/AsnC family transcriptional regulator, leucine-responsive regulatory protein